RGAVGVDVVHIGGGQTCLGEGQLHGLGSGLSGGRGAGDVVGVAGGAVADDLGVDLGAPGFGVLQLFQNEDAGAFTHDKAVPLLVKGDGGPVGVGGTGQRAHVVEAGDGQPGDGAFSAASHTGIQVAVLDPVEGLAHGVGGGGTGGDRGV